MADTTATQPLAEQAVPDENKIAPIITGGKELLEPMTDFMAPHFTTDPGMIYLLSSMTPERQQAYLHEYMHVLVKAAALNDGIFQHVDDWSSGAIWLKPGKKIDNPITLLPSGFLGCLFNLGIGGCKRMLIDFQAQANASKRAGLRPGEKKFHYLFLIATAERARGRGLASQIIRAQQERVIAAGDGLPIWLESTTERSRRVYERCGFTTVRVMELGKGTHGADGQLQKGGPGVKIWAMIWRPEQGVGSCAD